MSGRRRCRSRSQYGDCAKASKHEPPHEVGIGSGGGFIYGRGVTPGYVWGDDSRWEASWDRPALPVERAAGTEK